jgi:hypothetical protein
MQLDDRDIICEQDFSPLSNAELVAQIEENLEWLRGASLYDTERVMDPARALLARAESAEAEAAEARATNEALAELAASETAQRVALADWLTASRRFMKAHRHCRPQTVQPAAVEVGVSEFVQPAPEAQ